MSEVIKLMPKLGRTHYCLCSTVAVGKLHQAWSLYEPMEAIRNPDFFDAMTHCDIAAGDHIELFRVSDTDAPDDDPLSMVPLIVRKIETDRHGKHIRVFPTGDLLRFNADAPSSGVAVREWNGKMRVFRDGDRVASFNTRIEAGDFVTMDLGATDVVMPRLPESRPTGQRCRAEDIAVVAEDRKITRVLEISTLLPIPDILADAEYWALVRGQFRTGDRVNFVQFSNDARERVVAVQDCVLVDFNSAYASNGDRLSFGHLAFYPRNPVSLTGDHSETGWKIAQDDKLWAIRHDGRTVQRFPTEQHARWFLSEQEVLQQARAS